MTQRALLPLAACLLVVPGLVGCGESDDGDGGPGSGASSGFTTGSGGFGVSFGGNTGSGGNGAPSTFDGGSIPLTPEQEETIRDQACTGWSIEGEVVPSVLELVVDVSSSMRQTAPGSRMSKWDVTRTALLEAIVGVEGAGLPASVALGLLFYPNRESVASRQPQDITACVRTEALVPVAPLGAGNAAHRTLIRAGIEDVELGTGTPTHDAYRFALHEGLLPARFPGNKFMLLITDGEPTLSLSCVNSTGRITEVDPEPIVEEIENARREGVRTFLIGSPGSEANRNWMSRAAVLGGTAPPGCNVNGPAFCHMDMTTAPDFSAALRAGLADIAGQIAPCSYTFPPPPAGQTIDANKINLIVKSGGDSTLIVRDDIGDCSEGWQLTQDQEVVLCPATCERVQADAETTVELNFGCTSISTPVR